MNLCTKIVRKWRYVELVAATVRSSAKWGWVSYFDHCRKPAIASREATHWCEEHSGKNAPKEET